MSFAPPPEFPEDNINPYSAPRAELRFRPEHEGLAGTIPATIDAVLARAWEIFKARLGICLAIVLAGNAIYGAYSIGINVLQVGLTQAQVPPLAVAAVQFVLSLAGIVLQLWLTAGETVAMVRLAKGRDVEFAALFSGGPFLLSILFGSFLIGLMVLGILFACGVPAGIVAGAIGGQGPALGITLAIVGLVAVAALIVLSIRVSQFTYLIVDRGVGAIDALGLSNQITKGREGLVFLVWLMSLAANIVGFMACFIGLFFSVPFTFVLSAVLYVALTGQSTVPMLEGEDFLTDPKPLSPPDPDFGGFA